MVLGEIYISPFSSLTFDKITHPFEECVGYIQKFALSDSGMFLRFTSDSAHDFRLRLSDEYGSILSVSDSENLGTIDRLHSYRIPVPIAPDCGIYGLELQVRYGADRITFLKTCVEFISDEEAMNTTILFEATNKFDDWFIPFGEGDVAEWRITGGLPKNGFESAVIQNSFRDQRIRSHQLSQKPYTLKTLVLGDCFGVPIWAGEKLNFFLSLSDVRITYREEKKARIVRSEGEAPAMTGIADYYPLYIFKCRIEEQIEHPYYYANE
ncbi:MAG: hypothetical protein FWF53_04445 [Candidatus Azobacteroides sp.]|nr:hypothetical protein [Candidatus Azobacteroides sp.]